MFIIKKNLIGFILITPVVLYLVGSLFSFAGEISTGENVITSSLFRQFFLGGTIFDPILLFIVFAFLGIVMILSESDVTRNLGKAFYSIASINGFFIVYYMIRINYETEFENNIYGYTTGAYLLIISLILFALVVIGIMLGDLIEILVRKFYKIGPKTNHAANEFEQLKNWKTLYDDSTITKAEYEELKEKTLEKIKPRKDATYDLVLSLKNALSDSLIDESDFEKKKSELLTQQ